MGKAAEAGEVVVGIMDRGVVVIGAIADGDGEEVGRIVGVGGMGLVRGRGADVCIALRSGLLTGNVHIDTPVWGMALSERTMEHGTVRFWSSCSSITPWISAC